MAMKIEQIWSQLEEDKSSHAGLLYKRYSPEVLPDIFVALKLPEKLKCIAIRKNTAYGLDLEVWNKLRDIKVEQFPDIGNGQKEFLLIVLLEKQHSDIFSTLCEDLILEVKNLKNEADLINKLLNRLSKWQNLFEKVGQQGLSAESQRGLYGELYFLRKLLEQTGDFDLCLASWKGPERAIQDFQLEDWAVEVKTSHGKNHQKIHISSERQLDTGVMPHIFLYHLSLEQREGLGETLNEMVEQVFGLLNGNYIIQNAFKLKLIEYGYFSNHRALYEREGFSIRQERVFKVVDNFPRIAESQLLGGVGDVRYSILLSDSTPWQISFENLVEKILK
jgi:hypothetical protein